MINFAAKKNDNIEVDSLNFIVINIVTYIKKKKKLWAESFLYFRGCSSPTDFFSILTTVLQGHIIHT